MSPIDRVWNEEVRLGAGMERELESRANQRVLKCTWHMERMDDYRMTRGMSMVDVNGGRVLGRQRLGRMEGVMRER